MSKKDKESMESYLVQMTNYNVMMGIRYIMNLALKRKNVEAHKHFLNALTEYNKGLEALVTDDKDKII